MSRVTCTRAELIRACDEARAGGATIGVVPTMGALHQGHLSLVERARSEGATFVLVTIFVNPLQFGQGEDLDRYPRTLDGDLAACGERGVDLVFAPSVGEMYGQAFDTKVSVAKLTRGLEGSCRPDHFDGVTTVVAKLLNLTAPCIAVFGQKDYQQQAIIRRMVTDLDIRARIVTAPTVREPDGLALSSRNRHLKGDRRARATGIIHGLRAADTLFRGGERDPDVLVAAARAAIAPRLDSIDYVAAVDPDTLAPTTVRSPRTLLVVAAHIGQTRLIDNACLGEAPL